MRAVRVSFLPRFAHKFIIDTKIRFTYSDLYANESIQTATKSYTTQNKQHATRCRLKCWEESMINVWEKTVRMHVISSFNPFDAYHAQKRVHEKSKDSPCNGITSSQLSRDHMFTKKINKCVTHRIQENVTQQKSWMKKESIQWWLNTFSLFIPRNVKFRMVSKDIDNFNLKETVEKMI